MDGYGTQRVDTVVIGGGQAGLAIGYHLRKQGRPFVILDADARVGDSWRRRWDSLLLFTPARYASLPGGHFPGKGSRFPTKDELADYLESYATRLSLPVQNGAFVDRLWREGDRFMVSAGGRLFEADNVVVATGANRLPRIPAFADQLDPEIDAAPFGRVPAPVAAPRRRRPRRRRRELGRRHLDRGRARAPDVVVGLRGRARSVPHRDVGGAQRPRPHRAVRRRSRPHAPHPVRPEGSGGVREGRHDRRPREAEGHRGRRDHARPEGDRRARRAPRSWRTDRSSTWRT